MPLLGNYTTGTVTVAANGTAVTGAGTQWLAAGIREGDVFVARGLTATILSVNSATSLTLERPWPGTALSAAAYEVRYSADASRVLAASREAISLFGTNAAAIADAQLRKNNLTATRAPAATDDSSQGYAIGSRWMFAGDEWVATSAAPGAASWKPVGTGGGGTSVNLTLYSSPTAFYAAAIPASADMAFVTMAGEVVTYRRQPGASGPDDLHHPNGSDWAKATINEADILAVITDAIEAAEFIPVSRGDFTPNLFGDSGVALVVTGGSVSGRFNRIDNRVFFTVAFGAVTLNHNSAVGSLRIGNFPLAAASWSRDGGTITRHGGINTRRDGDLVVPSSVGFAMNPNSAFGFINCSYGDGGQSRPLRVSDTSTTAGAFRLHISGSYEVPGA